jgi:hypothetical protein
MTDQNARATTPMGFPPVSTTSTRDRTQCPLLVALVVVLVARAVGVFTWLQNTGIRFRMLHRSGAARPG